jgi:solute carrier family 25 (adenine nucleotide translocator) protein 4/5/6/31
MTEDKKHDAKPDAHHGDAKPKDAKPAEKHGDAKPAGAAAGGAKGDKSKEGGKSAEGGKKKKKGKGGAQQLLTDFMIGGSVGAVAKTVMAPVERVKLLMQTQDSNPKVISGEVKRYTGIGDCVKRVSAEQGFWSFWRGNLVNCLRYAPQQGSALAFNDAINDAMPKYHPKNDFWKNMGTKLMSGGLAGAMANTLAYPFDYARTRLASDMVKGKGQFNGIMDCISQTVKKQGITGLYTGWTVTVMGAFVYRAGQLGLFKQIQDLNPYAKDKGTIGAVSSFIAVTTARTAVMPFNYPFDTVRRRMMLQSEKPVEERLYKGSIDCFKQIMAKEGLKGMYKGMVPELFRGVGGSLVVVGYDRIKVIFDL